MPLIAGYGAEAAIGRLMRLTSLHMSIDRTRATPCSTGRKREATGILDPGSSLQLQLLGCSGASSSVQGSVSMCHSSSSSSSSGSLGTAARRNTSLQELCLQCSEGLTDDELAAAAAALPDLRQLVIQGKSDDPAKYVSGVAGLLGSRLAAFSACRRLRDISLSCCDDLDGQQLVRQLPRISSLVSLQLIECPRVDISAMEQLEAAFRSEHGRLILMRTE